MVDSFGNTKVIKYTGDEALGIPTLDLSVEREVSLEGPDSLPFGVFTFTVGSDEETHSFRYVLANQWDNGPTTSILTSAIYSIVDGPNNMSHMEAAVGVFSKWNKETKKYEAINKL